MHFKLKRLVFVCVASAMAWPGAVAAQKRDQMCVVPVPFAAGAKFSEAAALCGRAEAIEAGDHSLPDLPLSIAVAFDTPRVKAQRQSAPAKGDDLVTRTAARFRIDPALLRAMVRTESANRIDAISSKGALGLMQIMPGTARELGVAEPHRLLSEPELAMETGARYLKRLQARFGNDVPLVVAAYNAGPGAVTRHGYRVPPYAETRGYVRTVLSRYDEARLARGTW